MPRLLGSGSTTITSPRDVPVIRSTLLPGLSASSVITALPGRPGSFRVLMSHSGRPAFLTVEVAVALLLLSAESLVFAVTLAVLRISLPRGASLSICTINVNVALAPAGKVAILLVIEPVPPGAGVMLDQPGGAANETKVV